VTPPSIKVSGLQPRYRFQFDPVRRRKYAEPVGSGLRRLWIGVTAASLCVLMASACGEDSPEAKSVSAKDFDSVQFDNPTEIDNRWFPLEPGTRFTYEGSALGDNGRDPRRVVLTVTDLTKVVNGVRTLVIWDQDYGGRQLQETELSFFSQDNDGNVWNLGEYPEEYEDGKLVDAPAWIAGLKGARAGVLVKAEPQPEGPSYSQGYAPPPINWRDRARVYRTGQDTCVPAGCYEDVLVTEEFERTKPGAYQLKYYAPGVGGVRVGWRGPKEDERERLALVDLAKLDEAALGRAREQALEQERRAYRISKDVYGRTPPAEPLGAG
jgi:hypothetical protein